MREWPRKLRLPKIRIRRGGLFNHLNDDHGIVGHIGDESANQNLHEGDHDERKVTNPGGRRKNPHNH